MTIEQLKAAAYDTLAQIEQLKGRMQQINAEIGRLSEEKEVEPEEVIPPKPKK